MNSRVTVCLARVRKRHKCKFVPRLLSMIVAHYFALFLSIICIPTKHFRQSDSRHNSFPQICYSLDFTCYCQLDITYTSAIIVRYILQCIVGNQLFKRRSGTDTLLSFRYVPHRGALPVKPYLLFHSYYIVQVKLLP